MKRLPHWLCASLITTSLACDEKSSPPPNGTGVEWQETAAPAASGPQFDDEDFHLLVRPPKNCKKEGPMAPKKAHRRISVPIELKAKGARGVPVSALLFTLEDKDGHEFRPTLAGCAPSLPQKTLSGGQSIEGEVAFDVPKETGRLELRYEPFLIGRKKVSARAQVPVEE